MIETNDFFDEYSCKYIVGNLSDWNRVLEGIDIYDVVYMPHSIMYQEQYFTEKGEYYRNYSMIYYSENHPVGIWPLCVYKRDGAYSLGTNGRKCRFPLVLDDIRDTKIHKKMCGSFFRFLSFLCEKYNISKFEMEVNSFLYKLDKIYKAMAIYGNAEINYARHDLYVNLQDGVEHVWNRLSRGTRKRIIKSREQLICEVIDASSEDIPGAIEEFRQLHIIAAGRETRSKATWEMQAARLSATDGFIVFLKNTERKLIGGLLISSAPSVASTSVGAYRRELFDMYDMGHVCRMIAIERLCANGKKYLYMGEMPLAQDVPPPTDKYISIGLFKKSFATDISIVNNLIITPTVLHKARR